MDTERVPEVVGYIGLVRQTERGPRRFKVHPVYTTWDTQELPRMNREKRELCLFSGTVEMAILVIGGCHHDIAHGVHVEIDVFIKAVYYSIQRSPDHPAIMCAAGTASLMADLWDK
jgi:hypothetical protein